MSTKVGIPAQTNVCPGGETQVCLGGCNCLPDVGQLLGRHLREQLLRWYDPSVLDTVCYTVGDNGQFSAATAMLQNPDVGAVTLIDIILFRDAQSAEQRIALWAHVFKQVQPYREGRD